MIADLARRAHDRGLKGWGVVLLVAGSVVAFLALIVSANNTKHSSPLLCSGQSAVFGDFQLSLGPIRPIAGVGYTALEASMTVQRSNQTSTEIQPTLRDYLAHTSVQSGAASVGLWDGEFTAQPVAYHRHSGCMLFALHWVPMRNWLRYGVGLAGIGLFLLLLRPLFSAATGTKSGLNVTFATFVAVSLAGAFWLLRSPEVPPAQPFAKGDALIISRNQLIHPGRASFNRWIIMADAMTRRSKHSGAASFLQGAIEQDPNDPEGWLAMGDALFALMGGRLSPAAELAYDRADKAALHAGLPPMLVASHMKSSGRAELAEHW